ncbi:4-alpha-glucanotransferase [Nigerium massiliense]|uniref:4-alpha-glucanotransferase n=1 Tax=Nigerium massiliense TaxID=1522317 RepID=UPI00058B5EF5|nr:4-alpha-glucanotransferase [Nigerium massiliense]
MAHLNPTLVELADAFGIATSFTDWKGRPTDIEDDTIVGILAGMDVDASTPERAEAALTELQLRSWRRPLPPCVPVIEGDGTHVTVHVDAGAPAVLTVQLEDGGWRDTYQVDDWEPDRWVDDRLVGQATFWIPADLPTGYHRLRLESDEKVAESTLIVSPRFLGFPAGMGSRRVWGYSTQLYSVRSLESWGMGDLADLADLAIWSTTQQQASYVLTNPLHAAEPMPPIEPSPYLPSSRRYVSPLYIRPESIAEYATLPEKKRQQIQAIKDDLMARVGELDRIERDPIWTAKMDALRIVYDDGRSAARQMSRDDFVAREGRSLQHFAIWCVLVSLHGMNWREWPEDLRDPESPAVAALAKEHADDVAFNIWLQWVADGQLSLAQNAAKDAGMCIGVMNDLAVGVSQDSAEVWMDRDVFAGGVSVGAPPDHFNQLGQDWGQSPWRPDRLEELAYEPFRAMVAGILRHSGGIRIDHIMGLFRLWWVPAGMQPTKGSYVRYAHEAMVGIVILEATRAGALVVGEDLGTVEPWVRTYLRERGVLGTSVAWFERDSDGVLLPPERYREYCLASVTTHDLPPTTGYLEGNHLRLQDRLGVLTESLDHEMEGLRRELAEWKELLASRGLLRAGEGVDEVEQMVLAMHRFLTRTPSRVLNAALTDAVGDQRTQNQPGTIDEYPNWRVPLSGPDKRPLLLEEVFVNPRAARLAAVMNGQDVPPATH